MEKIAPLTSRLHSMQTEKAPSNHYSLRFGSDPFSPNPPEKAVGTCLGAPFRWLSQLNHCLEKGLNHLDDGLKQMTNSSPLSPRPASASLTSRTATTDVPILNNPTIKKFGDDVSTAFDSLLKGVFGEDEKHPAPAAQSLVSHSNRPAPAPTDPDAERKHYYTDLVKDMAGRFEIQPLIQRAKSANPLEIDINAKIADSLVAYEHSIVHRANLLNDLNAVSDTQRLHALKRYLNDVFLKKTAADSGK